MSDRARRLVAIEAGSATAAEPDAPIPDVDLEFLAWLDRLSLLAVLEAFALDLARRRFAHDHGCAWTVWFSEVDEDAEIRFADRELDAFTAGWIATGDLHEAIRDWLEEPDAAGWPVLSTFRPMNDDAFTARLAGHRDMLRVHRDWTGPLAQMWRERQPDLRADLLPDEYDRWELASLDQSIA